MGFNSKKKKKTLKKKKPKKPKKKKKKKPKMGSASKIISVFLRVGELCCSVVVLGLVGRVLWYAGQANTYADGRLIFAIVVASISTLASMLFMVPFMLTFYACPIDLVMFVLWLLTFIFIELISGLDTCGGTWYYNYWGYYWGGFWRRGPSFVVTGPWDIDWAGCGSLMAVLAFSFMASMAFLLSCLLGAYEVIKYKEEKKRIFNRNDYYGSKPPAVGNGNGVLHDHHTHSTVPV